MFLALTEALVSPEKLLSSHSLAGKVDVSPEKVSSLKRLSHRNVYGSSFKLLILATGDISPPLILPEFSSTVSVLFSATLNCDRRR
ncbi:hypothetical protein Tco_0762975 [Tanacetum coccineum]